MSGDEYSERFGTNFMILPDDGGIEAPDSRNAATEYEAQMFGTGSE